MFRNADGGMGVSFPGKKRYEGVRFKVVSVTMRWVGVKFPGKKHYVTLWPHTQWLIKYSEMQTDILIPVFMHFTNTVSVSNLDIRSF